MSRSMKVVSRDGLNKFISAFDKLTKREDLCSTDSDSESESVDEVPTLKSSIVSRHDSRLNNDQNAIHSVFSICIPRLEFSLCDGLSQTRLIDTIEGTVEWIGGLHAQNVLQSIRNFVAVLNDLTDSANTASLPLRQSLAFINEADSGASNHIVSQEPVSLTDVLLKLLVQSSPIDTVPPVVLFLLLLLDHNTTAAAAVVQRLLTTLRELTSFDHISTAEDEQLILQHIVHLQTVHKLMESYIHFSTTATASLYVHLALQLSLFSKQYKALFPIIACTIRSAMLHCAVAPEDTKYDLLEAVLSHPPSESALQQVYGTLCSVPLTSTNSTHNDSYIVGGAGSGADAVGAVTLSGGDSDGVVGDTGYGYLQSLSREETIKALYPLPAGSFLLRPHDSSSHQFFLSFRTSSGTTSTVNTASAGTTSANSAASGGHKRVSSGRMSPEATVKHAIIRRTRTASDSNNTNYTNNTNTTTPASPMRPDAGDDGNVSPLPVLLRQPHVHGTGVTSSSIGSTNSTSVVYQYQCGKIGPCDSMRDMLRQISSVLETPLIFTPVAVDDNSSHNSFRAAGAGSSSTGSVSGLITVPFVNTDTAHTNSLDLNHTLWTHVRHTTFTNTTHNTQYTSLQSSVNKTYSILEQPWQVAAQPDVMLYMFDLLLRSLAVSRFVSQLAPALALCESLVALDVAASTSSSSGSGDVVGLYQPLASQGSSTTSGSTSVNSPIPVAPVVFHSWLAPFRRHLSTQQARLQALLLPAPPLHCWYTPPLDCSIPRERPESSTSVALTAATTNTPYTTTAPHSHTTTPSAALAYAPADELLVAEHLLAHVRASVGIKSIRLTNSAGTEHITLPNCLSAEEVHKVVAQWWEVFVQHEGAVAQKVSARRMADRVRGTTNGAVGAVGAGSVEAKASTNTSSAVITDTTTATKLNVSQFDRDFQLPSSTTADYETAIVSSSTHTTPTTLSLALYTILKRVHAVLRIDVTTSSKEYTRCLVAWLSDELQIVYEIVRPGDFAFSVAQRFYCPHHPYEVKVLRDFTQAAERVRLGRHVYYSHSTSSSNSVSSAGASIGGSTSVASHRSQYFTQTVEVALRGGSTSASMSTTTSPTSAAVVSTDTSSTFEHDASIVPPPQPPLPQVDVVLEKRVAACATLWNLLGAEQHLSHILGSAATSHLREQLPVHYAAPSPDTATSIGVNGFSGNNSGGGNMHLTLPTSASYSNSASSTSAVTVPKELVSEFSTYLAALERCLYHNNLHSRLGFSTRSVPIVQVDLYALQEILAVRTVNTTQSSHAPVAIPSGVSPLMYMDLFNKPTLLTPTTSAHSAGALDIFTVMRLTHSLSSNNTHTSAGTSSSSGNKMNVHTPLSSKNCPIGSVISSVHKAEARRTPFEHASNNTSGASTSATSSTTIAPNWSKHQQQAVARAVEYNFREQSLFRFALPEGLTSLHPPAHGGTVTLSPYPEYTSSSDSAVVKSITASTSGPLSPLRTSKSQSPTLPPTVLHVPQSYFEAPRVLVVAVYERTFFSDTLLGELELDLSCLHEKQVIRGWYPLTQERSISWMVYLQVRLKLQDLQIETLHSAAGSTTGGGDSASGTGSGMGLRGASSVGLSDVGGISTTPSTPVKGGTSVHGIKIFKQMDDF